MKIEFPALESEPLIYFLMHSGVFVFALASVFFLLGMCMGATIWGRFKRQLQHMKLENAGQLQEIAVLKRKLAEQTMRPATSPLTPAPKLLTEVLPSVNEVFPERQATPTPPAVTTEVPTPPALPALAPLPEVPNITIPPVTEKPKTADIRPTIRAKTERPAPTQDLLPPALPVQTNGPSLPVEEEEVPAFGFLLNEAPDALIPASSISALAAIIKAPPSPVPSLAAAEVSTVPSLTSPAPPTPSPAILPEIDPALGSVYKIAPPDAEDLTRIKGISNALEKRLHELGIYTWSQIASWEERHIREFSSRLAFKDRIVREKWVEQSRNLIGARQSV